VNQWESVATTKKRSHPSDFCGNERRLLTANKERLIMTIPSHPSDTFTDPFVTSPEQRCLLAKSLLNHRDPSVKLAEMVTAVMAGATLLDLVALEVSP
jgi:hypothetical protein